MANEIKFRSEMPRIKNLDRGDAFLISRADGTAGYTLLADAVELRGAPFTYDQFTPSQLAALKGATGAPLTYDDLTTAQKAELVGSKLDQTLPAAAEVDDVARLYAQKTDGSPVLASATQIRELTGIDYSLLTEQIVPGEFAYNQNQERSQVYVRSFIATTSDSHNYTQLPLTLPNSGCVISAFGSVVGGTIWTYPITAASVIRYTSAHNSYGFTHAYSFSGVDSNGLIPVNATVYLTIKYVK